MKTQKLKVKINGLVTQLLIGDRLIGMVVKDQVGSGDYNSYYVNFVGILTYTESSFDHEVAVRRAKFGYDDQAMRVNK